MLTSVNHTAGIYKMKSAPEKRIRLFQLTTGINLLKENTVSPKTDAAKTDLAMETRKKEYFFPNSVAA